MDENPTDYIARLHLDNDHSMFDDQTWYFMAHASIVDSLQLIMDKFFIKNKWIIFDYKLSVGKKFYDMRIISGKLKNKEDKELNYLRKLKRWSQYSFPWQDNLTLFIELENFSILEGFIKKNDLAKSISKVEEQIGITENDGIIKVITFKSSINKFKILLKYQRHLRNPQTFRLIFNNIYNKYYFITNVFPWQKKWMRNFCNTSLKNDFCITFAILLDHLQTIKNNNGINIFDLISLRLALCEFFNSSAISYIKTEIDFMVKRELAKIVTNDHLNFDQYFVTKNYNPDKVLISYMIYEFQMYFKTFSINKNISNFEPTFQNPKINKCIVLVKEDNIFDTINGKTNANFIVDGKGYNQMSLSLFVQFVNFSNVVELRLDTNFMWFSNQCNLIQSMSTDHGIVQVHLIGDNTYNFVEDFISSFKTVTFAEAKDIYLTINCSLSDYSIFDNIKIYAITFSQIKIDTHILDGLNRCNLEFIKHLRFRDCTYIHSTFNWKLLFSLRKLYTYQLLPVTIQEDEGTLLTLFEYILDELITSKLKEFSFNGTQLHIVFVRGREVYLSETTFSIDEQNSKLEIQYNDQNVDVFDWKFQIKPDEKSDYDFYQ